MMQNWTAEHIRFMEDAANYGTFHQSLAQLLLLYLPQGGRLCDAGCGLGHLSLTLAPFFQTITACDIAQPLIDRLKTYAPQNVQALCCDIFASPPSVPYDAMVLCLFGHTQEILPLAKQQCRGSVAVIKRADSAHRFTAKPIAHSDHTADLEELLSARKVPFIKRSLTLEFGQPLRSTEDALLFFRLYGLNEPLPPQEIFRRLQPINHPQFSYYLPQTRHLHLIIFDSRDL